VSNIDVNEIRKDFPFFDKSTLAYLDNSATTQRPRCVVEAVADYYYYHNSNPFRGLYELSVDSTDRYEAARERVARFIGAKSPGEIIFVRNATEALNLAAAALSIKEGDEVITSVLEHHSNMLPWRLAAEKAGATVRYMECTEDGELTDAELRSLISDKTRVVALSAMSNVFGRANDIKTLAATAHEYGAVFVADGAQSVPHSITNVCDLGVDMLAFSGHKLLAPMGIGVLYCREELMDKLSVYMSGGEMIEYVTLDDVSYAELPHRFEAGTVNAGGAVGLAAAIDYIESIGMEEIETRELELTRLALDMLSEVPHITVLGDDKPEHHRGIITFKIDNVHPHDIAAIMADDDVAIRAGHHCAEPLHHFIGIPSTTRASLMFYNTEEEIEKFVRSAASIRGRMGYKD